MENFKNKLRLIGFVPIGSLANSFAVLILFAISSIFFEWTFQDIISQKIPFEKIAILVWLINVPCKILGYKISHIIKPPNLSNKKFIITHSFFIGLTFALNIGSYFWAEGSTMQLYGSIGMLIEIGVFTLIIKDRRYNLFNMS